MFRSHTRSHHGHRSGVPSRHQPLVLCAECAKCSDEFRVAPEIHARNRGFVEESREHGGNLGLDFQNHLLIDGDNATGGYNELSLMQRGVVDWHSHPRPCNKQNECAIGVPSPADVVNVAIGAMYGSATHLLYSPEGTYCLQIAPEVLRKTVGNRQAALGYLGDITTKFYSLDAEFQHGKIRYAPYIEKWLKTANSNGVGARLFKGDAVPVVRIHYDCQIPIDTPLLHPVIDVPADEEAVLTAVLDGRE